MSDDPHKAGLIPATIETYYLVLLHKGPTWHVLETPEELDLQNRHLAFLKSLYEAGKILAYGPTVGAPDNLRGINIVKASSAEEARTMLEQDPRFLEGHFIYEVITWMADSRAWRER